MSKLVPSPALGIAFLALLAATGGATYAATKVTTADIATGAVTSDKIADRTIRTADIAPDTVSGLRGARGATGPAGTAGSARAYADVSSASHIVHSKGVAAVTRSTANIGVYCVSLASGVSTAGLVAVVGVDYNSSVGSNLSAYFSTVPSSGCASGTDFAVRTFAFAAGGDNAPSNQVGFDFLVP